MEIFSEVPSYVYVEDVEFSTLINEAESGKEKRRNKWPAGYAKRTFKLEFNNISQTIYSNIVKFFIARSGMKEAFLWENFTESPILNLYPSKITVDGDYGSEDTTSLPHVQIIALSETIYDDGVALTRNVDYTIVNATGVITWINKPAAASVITANYRFYREVRFDIDKLSPENVSYHIYNVTLTVRETEPRL